LAGSYELEVLSWLSQNLPRGDRALLNIGAGDGFYAVGLKKLGMSPELFASKLRGNHGCP